MKLIAGRQWFFSLSLSFAVDTEIPIIKHSSSPPALPTHNQTQQISHQNQQQTHHQTQRNHLQTSHHHQQQQKQVSSFFFLFSFCSSFIVWCALFSTLQICNHLKSILTWPTEYLLALFHHIAFIISDFDCTKLNNTSVLYSFFSLLCDSIRFCNSNNNSYRIDHCCITYWVERQHHITEIIVHRVQVSGFNNNFFFGFVLCVLNNVFEWIGFNMIAYDRNVDRKRPIMTTN